MTWIWILNQYGPSADVLGLISGGNRGGAAGVPLGCRGVPKGAKPENYLLFVSGKCVESLPHVIPYFVPQLYIKFLTFMNF